MLLTYFHSAACPKLEIEQSSDAPADVYLWQKLIGSLICRFNFLLSWQVHKDLVPWLALPLFHPQRISTKTESTNGTVEGCAKERFWVFHHVHQWILGKVCENAKPTSAGKVAFPRWCSRLNLFYIPNPVSVRKPIAVFQGQTFKIDMLAWQKADVDSRMEPSKSYSFTVLMFQAVLQK